MRTTGSVGTRSTRTRSRRPRTQGPGLEILVVALLATIAFAGLCPSAGASGPSGRDDGGFRHGGRCRKPLAAGLHTVDVVQQGVHRTFQLWVPAGYDGRPVPLLFWLHGSSSTGEAAMATADPAGRPIFKDDADEHGYAVATPSGSIPFSPAPGFTGFAWNIPGVPLVGTSIYPPPTALDDVAYIGLAIDAVAETMCIDESRVYASGASGGGRMASQLACDLSDRIAAIAPVMGVRAPRASDTPGHSVECAPTRPVPVVAIHGRLDPVNVFAGDDPRIVPGSSWTYGVEEALRRWAALNGCSSAEPRRTAVAPHVDRVDYRGCSDDGKVTLYDVADGGHTVPGTAVVPFLVPLIGPTNQELDTPDAIWSFVSRQRLEDSDDDQDDR